MHVVSCKSPSGTPSPAAAALHASSPATPSGSVQLLPNIDLPGPVTPQRTPNVNWAQHFRVDWSSMPNDLMSALHAKQVPLPKARREMVRQVVKQICKFTSKPGRQNLRVISAKIVSEWPGCFDDRIGDVVVGSGYYSLFTQLENGLDNANRGSVNSTACKRLVMHSDSAASVSDIETVEKKRNKTVDEYGCINANPKQLPEGETDESIEEKRLQMIEMYNNRQDDDEKVKDLMTVTYYSQRATIRDVGHRMTDVRERFPFLFSHVGLSCHFENLLGIPLSSLNSCIAKQYGHIMSFMASRQLSQIKNVIDDINRAKAEMHSTEPELFGIVCLLSSYFEEDVNSLFILQDATIAVSEVDGGSLPPHPCIVVLGRYS